jgi:serine protease inhibitor
MRKINLPGIDGGSMNRTQISAANCCGGIFAALLCFLAFEAHAVQTPNPGELISANSGFAFNLFKQLVAEQPGSNIFISPYSASTVLQMVCSGAAGATSTEMQQMLGTIDMPLSRLVRSQQGNQRHDQRQEHQFCAHCCQCDLVQKGVSG